MKSTFLGKLIILAGPSGVGKTNLKKVFSTFYQDYSSNMVSLVLFTSRAIRPGETEGSEYYFRSREDLKKLNHHPQYILFKVHDDYQAIDMMNLLKLLRHNDVFFEGNTIVGRLLQSNQDLKDIKKVSIFLSPFTGQELLNLRSHGKKFFRETIQQIMRQKLLNRLRQSGRNPNSHEIKDINLRASDAYFELKEACHFEYIIPNHDGEDSENWKNSLLPSGDAGRALDTLAAILTNKLHPNIEKWEENLVP